MVTLHLVDEHAEPEPCPAPEPADTKQDARDVAEAAIHLQAAIREGKLALQALGIDWKAEVDRGA